MKEINRVKIIQDVIEHRMTTRRAAEHLGISDRQCRRLLVRYRKGGPLSLASRRCGMRGEEGKKSQRSLNNDDMLEALKQFQSQSEEMNWTIIFCEGSLRERLPRRDPFILNI